MEETFKGTIQINLDQLTDSKKQSTDDKLIEELVKLIYINQLMIESSRYPSKLVMI